MHPGWSQTGSDLPASASEVLRLQGHHRAQPVSFVFLMNGLQSLQVFFFSSSFRGVGAGQTAHTNDLFCKWFTEDTVLGKTEGLCEWDLNGRGLKRCSELLTAGQQLF